MLPALIRGWPRLGEEADVKASRLPAALAALGAQARSIHRNVIAMASGRLGLEIDSVPVLLLDGTGERAGNKTGAVALHLAIGLVSKCRNGKRVSVEARLWASTVTEGWSEMGDLLACVCLRLILVNGEEELSVLAAKRSQGVPVQRCLWHPARSVYRTARYTDRASEAMAEDFRHQLEPLLAAACQRADESTAQHIRLLPDTLGWQRLAATMLQQPLRVGCHIN